MTRSGHFTWHLHERESTAHHGLVRDHQRGLREGGDPGGLVQDHQPGGEVDHPERSLHTSVCVQST